MGGKPHRLPHLLPGAPKIKPASGSFNARGRGAKLISTFPRSSQWTFDSVSGLRVRRRQAFVKHRVVKATAGTRIVSRHLTYLEREGVQRDGSAGRLFSTFTDEADRKAFIARADPDGHHFRVIISPDDSEAYADLKPFTRDLMARLEVDLDTTLDWVAADHYDTGMPHVHLVIRGTMEDGRALYIAGDYLRYGIAHRASEVVTRDLGLEMESEPARQFRRDIDAERFTDLDRALIDRADNGLIDLRISQHEPDMASTQQHLIARMRRLELMQLAHQESPFEWKIAPDTIEVLQKMETSTTRIRAVHRVVRDASLTRLPQFYVSHDAMVAPVVGRILSVDSTEGEPDRHRIVLDGLDGRVHSIDIGIERTDTSIGRIVRVGPRNIGPRKADKTIAEIAACNDGRYSEEIHLQSDRAATIDFAESHTRRLEAISGVVSSIGRDFDGTWRIGPDFMDRVEEYERLLARARPVTINTLSKLPLDLQVQAEGVTWLDRQLAGEIAHQYNRFGFGEEVHSALVARRQWLVDQGLVKGDNVPAKLLERLESREISAVAKQLSRRMGKQFVPLAPYEPVEGVFRTVVELTSGRFSLLEKAHEFALVPWKPEIDRYLGRRISGICVGDTYEWSFGRDRSPSL